MPGGTDVISFRDDVRDASQDVVKALGEQMGEFREAKRDLSETRAEYKKAKAEFEKGLRIKVKSDLPDVLKEFDEYQKKMKKLSESSNIQIKFQTQHNAEAELKSKWNDLVNKNINSSMADVISADSEDAEEVARLAIAFEALGGDLASVTDQLPKFVKGMQEAGNLIQFTDTVDHYKEVFRLIREYLDKGVIEIQDFYKELQMPQKVEFFGDIGQQVQQWRDEVVDGIHQGVEGVKEEVKVFGKALDALTLKQQEYYKKLEEAKRKAKENRPVIESDRDYENNNAHYDAGLEIGDTDTYNEQLVKLRMVLDKLKEWQNYYSKNIKNMNDSIREAKTVDELGTSFEDQFQNAQSYFNNYEATEAQIEYIMNRISEVTKQITNDMSISDNWDKGSINSIIQLVKLLNDQVTNLIGNFKSFENINFNDVLVQISTISKSLETVVENSANTVTALGTASNKSFDTSGLTDYLNKLNDIKTAFDDLYKLLSSDNGLEKLVTTLNNIGTSLSNNFDISDEKENFASNIKSIVDTLNSEFGDAEKNIFSGLKDAIDSLNKAFNPKSLKSFSRGLDEIKSSIQGLNVSSAVNFNLGGFDGKELSSFWSNQYDQVRKVYDLILKTYEELYGLGAGGTNPVFSDIMSEWVRMGGKDSPQNVFGVENINLDGTIESYQGAIRIMTEFIGLVQRSGGALNAAYKESESDIQRLEKLGEYLSKLKHPKESVKYEDVDAGIEQNTQIMSQVDNVRSAMESISTEYSNYQQKADEYAQTLSQDFEQTQAEQSNALQDMFKYDDKELLKSLGRIENALKSLQEVFKKGFGISDDQENSTLTFFEQLSQSLQDVSKSFKSINSSLTILSDAFETLASTLSETSEATSTLQQLSQQSGIKGFIGFDANDINKIASAFTELKGTLVTIRDLIQHSLNIDETTMNQILRNAQENTEPLVQSSKMVEKKKEQATKRTRKKAEKKNRDSEEQTEETVQQQLFENQADQARKLFEQGKENGRQQFEGQIQGNLEKAQDLFNTVDQVEKGVKDTAEKRLGIGSPSRVFKAIAKYCIEGSIIGFQEGQESLVNTVSNVFDLKDKISGLSKDEISKLITDITARIGSEFENSDTSAIQSSVQSYFNSIIGGDSIGKSLETMGESLKGSQPQEMVNQILGEFTEQGLDNPEVDKIIEQKIADYKKGIDFIDQYVNDLKAKQDEFAKLSGGKKNTEVSRIDSTIQSMQNLSSEIVNQVGYEDVYEQLGQRIEQLQSIQQNISKYGTIEVPSGANLAKGIEEDYKSLEETIARVKEEIKQLISAENNKIKFSEDIDSTVQDITEKLVDKIVTNIKFDKVEEAAQEVQTTLNGRKPFVASIKFEDTTNSLNGLTSQVSQLQQAISNPIQGTSDLEQTQSQLDQTGTKVDTLTEKFAKLVETFRQTGDKQAFINALNTRDFTKDNMVELANSNNIKFSKNSKDLKKDAMATELVEGISKQMTGLNTVENRIDALLGNIESLNTKIGALWGNYNSAEAIRKLQEDVKAIDDLIKSIGQKVSDSEQQVTDEAVSEGSTKLSNLSSSINSINEEIAKVATPITVKINPDLNTEALTKAKESIDNFVQSIGANAQNINIKDTIAQYETLMNKLKSYQSDPNQWSQFTIFSPDDSESYAQSYITQIYKLIQSIKPEDFQLLGINPDGDEGYLGYLKNIQQKYTELIRMNVEFNAKDDAFASEMDQTKRAGMFQELETLDSNMMNQFKSLLDEINNLMGKASENSKNMVDASVQVAINEYEKLRAKIADVQGALEAIYSEMNKTHKTTTSEIIGEFQTLYNLIDGFPQKINNYNNSIGQIQPLNDNVINKFRDFNGAFNKSMAALSSFNLYMTNFANSQGGITAQVAQIINAIDGFGGTNFDSTTVNQAIGELGSTAQTAHSNITNLRNLLSQSSASGNYTVFDSELNALDEMIRKIRDEVPQAVEIKNNAFQTELEIVRSVVYQEIQAFNDLAGQLSLITTSISDLFKDRTIDVVPNTYGVDLNSLGESLNSDIANTMNLRNQAFLAEGKVVERIVKSESGHIKELGKAINDFMKSIDFKKIGIEKLDGISKMFANFNNMVTASSVDTFVQAIKDVSNELSQVSQDIGDNNIFSVINSILGKSKELEHLVTILKSTRQELEAIKKQQQQGQQQQQPTPPTPPSPPSPPQPPQSTYTPQQTSDPIVRTRIVGQNGANWRWDDFFSEFEGAEDSVKESVERHLGEIVRIVETYEEDKDSGETKLLSSSVYGTQASVVLRQRYMNPKDQDGTPLLDDDGKPLQIPYVGMSPFTSTTLDESRGLKLDALFESLVKYEHELSNAGLLTDEFKQRITEVLDDIVALSENNHASLDSVMVKDKQLRQDVRDATKESDTIFKNSIAIINQYIKARNDYNNLLAESVKNQNHVTQADLDQAKAAMDALKVKAEDAMTTLKNAGIHGLASEDHVTEAQNLFDANVEGGAKSQRNIRNANYDHMLSIAKELVKVQDELNKLRAEDIKHGNESLTTDNRREDALRRQVDLQQQYDDAYLRLLDMQEQGLISDSQIQTFLNPLQSGQITSGTAKTQDTVAGAMASEYTKAEKAVANYEKQLERVERYQRMSINGENVSGRLQGAINNLKEARKEAQAYLDLLKEINKTNQQQGFSAQYTQDQLDAIGNPLNDTRYNGAVSGVGVGRNAGFENAINGYETLTAAAQRYYKIQQKLATGSKVSLSDMEFLRSNDLDAYFKAAEQSAMSFMGRITQLQTPEQQAQWAEAIAGDPEAIGNKLKEAYEKFQQSRSDAMRNIISSMTNDLQNNLNQMDEKIADKPASFVNKLENLREVILKGTPDKDGLLTRIGDMTDADWANMNIDQYKDIIAEIQQYNSELAKLDKASQPVNQLQKATLDRKMSEWKSIHSGAREANADITKLQEALRNVDSQSGLNDVNVEFQRIVTNANNAGKTGISFANQLKQSFTNLSRYLMSFASFYRIINTIKQGVTVVKELDTAMTNLRKVVDDSDTAFKKFERDAFTIAGTVGSTAKDIVDAATEWGRLGYNLKESTELAKASAIYANVGDINVTTATSDLVSALKAFGKDADEAMGVVDILNEIGRL